MAGKEGFIKIYPTKARGIRYSTIKDSNGREVRLVRTFEDVFPGTPEAAGPKHWVGPWDSHLRLIFDSIDPTMGSKQLKMGVEIIKVGHEMALHSHDVEEGYIIIKGEGISFTDTGEEHKVKPYDALYHSPNVIHCLKNISPTEDLWIVWAWGGSRIEPWDKVADYVGRSDETYKKK